MGQTWEFIKQFYGPTLVHTRGGELGGLGQRVAGALHSQSPASVLEEDFCIFLSK